MKIAVCTTFPEHYWDICAEEMVRTFNDYWPEECTLFIALDALDKQNYDAMYSKISDSSKEGRSYFVSNNRSVEHEKFINSHTDDLSAPYRFHAVRFCHKVFALQQTHEHIKQEGYDYLIWLDADVITKGPISLEKLKEWLPKNDELVSYFGRTDAPHSECGFVGYHVGTGVIDEMVSYYTSGKVFELQGWTDCDVFDDVVKDNNKKNLTEGVSGWHVLPQIEMGQYLEHRKGNRKMTQKAQPEQPQKSSMNLNEMTVKTKNCVDGSVIRQQVRENLSLIRNWVKPLPHNDEEIVICSAGESLNREDILPFYERSVKIVAVKHAIDRLKDWGITPWACILLDPRPHVEKFVEKPDKNVIYFVSSMVHPSVVRSLNKAKCTVIGYHAHVNAGEEAELMPGDFMVSGGSATATRGISLLNECLGFRTFHCFGYDLCYFGKPEKQEILPDGNPKYVEVTLSENTWGGIVRKKTFWTEGQFLAQAKELRDLYAGENPLNITVYGDGIGGWCFKQWKDYKSWGVHFRGILDGFREKGLNVNEWIRSIT